MKMTNKVINVILIVISASIVAFGFQNCAGGMQSLRTFNSLDKLMSSADLSWSAVSGQGAEVTRLGQVSRWTDRSQMKVSLFPPLIPNSTEPDLAKAPNAVSSPYGQMLEFPAGSYINPQVSEASYFFSDRMSFVFFVRNIKFPAQGEKWVRLFELIPEETSEAGHPGVDVINLDNGSYLFRAFSYFSVTSVAVAEVTVPVSSLEQGFGIAVRFGNDPATMRIVVNGQSSSTVLGTVPILAKVVRRLTLHTPYQTQGSFEMATMGMWKSEFSDSNLSFFAQAVADLVQSGSYSGGPDSGGSGSEFDKVKGHLSSCTSCHDVATAAALRSHVSGGVAWVIPGNGAGSLMIRSIRHQSGVRAMPEGKPQLSSEAIAALEGWINSGAK